MDAVSAWAVGADEQEHTWQEVEVEVGPAAPAGFDELSLVALVALVAGDRADNHDQTLRRWRVRVAVVPADPGHRRILGPAWPALDVTGMHIRRHCSLRRRDSRIRG